MENETNTMRVEVAYALAHEQLILPVDVPVNVTIEDAIAQSGITKNI